MWRVDFKYNNELTQTFMSSNQIGGFFNRLEASRKYLFGSMGVLGTTGDSIISGVLILRGQDHKAVVDVAPDWESYTYKELKVTGPDANAEDKAFFEAALAWDLEIDGKKWADGKNVSVFVDLGHLYRPSDLATRNSSSKSALLCLICSARCIIYSRHVLVMLVSLVRGTCCVVAVSLKFKKNCKEYVLWCAVCD